MIVSQEKLDNYEAKEKRRKEIKDKAGDLQILRNKGAVKAPIGVFRKRCPHCGNYLTRTEAYYIEGSWDNGYSVYYRRCLNPCCQYEWGSINGW